MELLSFKCLKWLQRCPVEPWQKSGSADSRLSRFEASRPAGWQLEVSEKERGRELEVKLGRKEGGVCHETGECARVCVCVWVGGEKRGDEKQNLRGNKKEAGK